MAILLFQKLLAFGLYLNGMDLVFYVFFLSCLEIYNNDGGVDIESKSVMCMVVYMGFWCGGFMVVANEVPAVYFGYAGGNPGSCQCAPLMI